MNDKGSIFDIMLGKELREYLEDANLVENFIQNCCNYSSKKGPRPVNNISSGFNWERAPEGGAFWAAHERQLRFRSRATHSQI